jgi:hypothetical protein
MPPTTETKCRYILAAAYNADEYDNASHVLMQVAPCDLALAEKAMAAAAKFDEEMQKFFGPSSLTTGNVGGEFVLTSLPDELAEWLEGKEDPTCADALLLPRSLDPTVERTIEAWREDEIRWPSSYMRLKCSADAIHVEVEAKFVADLYVWTRDLAPIFAALKVDFETEELSTTPTKPDAL